MHNLESSIKEWRERLEASTHLGADTLSELETHLRETVAQGIHAGLGEAEAFQQAVAQFGAPLELAQEFRKLRAPLWLPAKIAAALMALLLALLLVFPFTARIQGHLDVLLTLHGYALILGYGGALFLSMLGICFVCQRCWAEFPVRRLRSLERFSFGFAAVAATFVAVGIVLGMCWSYRQWGHFWNWDPRELGAVCVLAWLLASMPAQRSPHLNIRGMLGVLGVSIVSLAWLGPNLLPGRALHSYGTNGHLGWLLSVIVAVDVGFLLLAFTPVGWLRRRSA